MFLCRFNLCNKITQLTQYKSDNGLNGPCTFLQINQSYLFKEIDSKSSQRLTKTGPGITRYQEHVIFIFTSVLCCVHVPEGLLVCSAFLSCHLHNTFLSIIVVTANALEEFFYVA